MQKSKPRKEEGEEVLHAWQLRVPCRLWGRTQWDSLAPEHIKVHGGAETHLQPMESPPPEQVHAWRRLRPSGKLECWSRALAGTVCPGGEEPMQEQDLWHHGEPVLEQLLKDWSPWEGLTLEKLVKDCLLWEDPHTSVVEEGEECSYRKEAAGTMWDDLTV